MIRQILLSLLCLMNCQLQQVLANELNVTGSMLFWKAKQKGLAFTTQPEPVFTTTDFAAGNLATPTFDWKPGLRLTAEVILTDSPCYPILQLIQYGGHANDSKIVGANEGIFPTLSFANTTLPTDYVTSASIEWNLQTTIFDISGSCQKFSRGSYFFAPSIAIRNAWVSQHVSTTYQGALFSAGPDTVDLRSSFFGVGPRIGIKPFVPLPNGLTFYGEIAGSLLASHFKVRQQETFISTSTASLSRSINGMRWNVDLIAGLAWEYLANPNDPIDAYTADLGFDFLYFSKQYPFKHGPQFSLRGQDNDLMLYGFHASFGLRF